MYHGLNPEQIVKDSLQTCLSQIKNALYEKIFSMVFSIQFTKTI